MKKMTGSEIRKMFLQFFKSNGHMVEPGASLVPHEDPTLLWINSGVAAIKKYFDGSVVPANPRIVNAQKSIRTNDIENVGYTARHHTFFEMLGNFSVGDYFREGAIYFAWELLTSTEWFAFDKDLLYVTVYPSDTDTYNLWIKLGVDASHIFKLEGNYWEIGAGPCGPCTEIFYDRGSAYDPENRGSKLLEEDIENDRYIEIWNIVFSQFNSDPALKRHEYKPLPSQNIDTGMGLERMACILQDTQTNFETDLFMPIIEKIAQVSGNKYEGAAKVAFKIIADHVRTVTFAVADGAMLSNEGRGYVLRRLLRRAVRHGKKLGAKGAFLFELVPVVAEIMKDFYPTVFEKISFIQGIIKDEEERFLRTLADGERKFNDIAKSNTNVISGIDAFILFDTYGFPFELTLELAKERGLSVDRDGFIASMEVQKNRARRARAEMEGMTAQNEVLLRFKEKSVFVDTLTTHAKVILLLKDGVAVNSLEGKGQIILDKTPFYATSGGQVADDGFMQCANAKAEVKDVAHAPHGQHLHTIYVSGKLNIDDKVKCQVVKQTRRDTTRNHTATHLLHQALKDVLGEHVNQAGSMVNNENLRFDFSYNKALSANDISDVQRIVNQKIFAGIPVEIAQMTLDDAKAKGARALFGEKYDVNNVRVVSISNYSVELCGGLHVNSTAEIGLFKIISESGIGAGVRRIEAVTGQAAYEYTEHYIKMFEKFAKFLKTNPDLIEERLVTIIAESKAAAQENESLKSRLSYLRTKDIIDQTREVNGFTILTAKLKDVEMSQLREMIDTIKEQLPSVVAVLASEINGKVAIACGVTKDYVKQGLNAGTIVKAVAIICGGNGGGRPDMATAGAKDVNKIEEGFAEIATIIEENKQNL